MIKKTSALITIGMGCCFSANVWADPEDPIRPYVYSSILYDDNFFKVDKDAQSTIDNLGGEDHLSDWLTTYGGGVDVNVDVSRQNFVLNADVSQNNFDKNEALDYVGEKYSAKWNWKAGKNLSGETGYNYEKGLASFSDNQGLGLNGASHVEKRYFFEGNWLLHPRWNLGSRVSGYESDYIKTNTNLSDRDDVSYEVFVDYISLRDNKVGLKYRQTDTSYPARNYQEGSVIDDEYSLKQYLLTTNWKLTGKSILLGEVGWQELVNKHLSERDYSDWSMRLSHLWFPSGNFDVFTSVWHSVGPADSIAATYQYADGIRAVPTWHVTAKTDLSAQLSYENRSLEGGTGQEVFVDKFDDTYYKAMISWKYQANMHLGFDAGYMFSMRESSAVNRDYISNSVYASVKAQW